MEDTNENEELLKQCSSLAAKMNDNQNFGITSQGLMTKESSAVDICGENKSTVQQVKKTTASRTPNKGVNTKSPSKGLKRTPKKNLLKIKASFTTPKKRRLQVENTLDDLQIKRLKKQDGKNEGNDEDEWQDIVDAEESENLNVDLSLEQKASKVKMNAKNVKSVIHHVLTNEHVLSMFKSVLESENCDISQKVPETPKKSFTPEKLDCFPKLTRAKVKDLLEKVCVPSPLKSAKDGPSILEVEFAEEEDDDEYNPEKDEQCHESDDDESLVSSQLSEFGSPYPATPSTPITRNAQEESLSLTPVQLAQADNLHLGTPRNLVSAFNKSLDSAAEEEYRVDTIALRTRSKLPLTSTSITEIESAFVAPDITPDMYDNTYEDADWAQFLSSLCKPSDETITDDDTDANDPEFNYIAEAEREQLDEEDFRFDKPTQITKKELSTLLNELNDMFEDEILPYQVVASVPDISSQNMEQLKYNSSTCQMQDFGSSSSATYAEFKAPQPLHQPVDTNHQQLSAACSYPMNQPFMEEQQQFNDEELNNHCQAVQSLFTPEQIALVEDNLRKHVQLLIQSFLLLQGKEFQIENVTSPKAMLSELETFRHDSPLGQRSIYNIFNLDPALQLLKDGSLFLPEQPVQQKPSVIQWNTEGQCYLTEVQKRAVYNSSAFVYPSLLPTLNKGKKTVNRKYNKFLPSEDNLIALGLEQFQYCRNVNPVELIHKLLIRGKNANQIHFRIQFMSSPKVGDNPIKSVRKTGMLPIDFLKPVVNDYCPMPPKDQITDNLPLWCLSLKESYKQSVTKNQLTGSEKPPFSAGVSKSRRKSKKIKLSSEIQPVNEGRTQALPTIILPSSMAPVSGIFIQFGPASTFSTSSQAIIASPFSAKTQNIFTVTNSDSCSSCSLKPLNPTSSLKEQCLTTSSQVELTDVTAGTEERPPKASPSSPDVLAKTMISCGIHESPGPLSISPYGSETMTTSTPHQVQNKHPIVRNLSSAFDAAHNASKNCAPDTESRLPQHNPCSAKAVLASSQVESLEKKKSSFESDGDSTLKADSGRSLIYNSSGGDQEPTMHSPLELNDSVSDHEPNLVIEESNISSSQGNVLPKEKHQVSFDSENGTDSSTNNPSHYVPANQDSSQASSNSCTSPKKPSERKNVHLVSVQDGLLTKSSKNDSRKENSKARREKLNHKAESGNEDNNNANSSQGTWNMKETEAKTPTKLRSIVPKPETPSSPYTPLPKMSPRRKELNRQVRQILPKSFVFEAKSPSPTKAAALALKKKATMLCQQRSPVKILPKSPQPTELLSSSRPRVTLTPSRMYTRSQHIKTKNSASTVVTHCSHGDNKQDKKLKDIAREELSGGEEPNLSQEEEEEDEAFGEDDQIQLEDLMAASTTIRYDPKKGNSLESDTKTKSQRKKDVCLAILDPDIIECDPKKDERDTAYAQYYFNCVKEVLKDDPERFRKFLFLLHSQNKDHCNPIELYADLATLLSDHQDLVDDFAGFLLSFQAVECQCFVSSLEYQQIRSFLRQLEIYCDTSSLTFQRTLKMMSKWLTINQDAQTDTTPFKDRIASILRHVPGLMDDLLSYFFDAPLPECHPNDFEDVTLDEVFDIGEIDKFEEVTLPDGREEYNTRYCSCKCHNDTCDKKFFKRSKHCISCSLKMFEGKPILKMWRSAYRDVSIVYPLEEKEKLAKAKKEAALIALAKARAQRQQKKKNKKKIRKIRSVDTKRKKRNSSKAGNNVLVKNVLTICDNKNFVECVQDNSSDLTGKEVKDNKDSFQQKVLEPIEECVNSIDKVPMQIPLKDKDNIISDVSEVPVSSLARSTYTSLFLPSATSSPISSKSDLSSGTPHGCSLTDSSSHANTLTEAVNMVDNDSTVLASAQTPTGSLTDCDKDQQKLSKGLEKSKQPSSRSTKSKPKLSQSKKFKTYETPSNPPLVAPLFNQPLTGSLMQAGSINPAITPVRFPAQTASLFTVSNTPIIQARIPVMVYLQPQDSLPETPKAKAESTKVSSRKSRKKSETIKPAPVTSNRKHVETLKPIDQPSETPGKCAPAPALPTRDETHLPKSPISGLVLSEPCHITSNVHPNTDEESIHEEPPVTEETIITACSSALNKTTTSTVDLHTSDTSSIFHFSPSKFKGKIPDVVRAYLDNFSLGGFDETMDIHVQQLAQAISPGKAGTHSSRFNLLAYLDSSNLTFKDGTSMNLGKSENETETRTSFSGALSEAIPSTSEKGLDLTMQSKRLHNKEDSSVTHAKPLGTLSGFQSSPESIQFKETPGLTTKDEVVTDTEDLEDWSEDADRCILNIVAVEGITSLSLNKIQQLIPDKSVTEIHARAKLLLQMLQTVGDSESDTGISCDDSSNM